MPRTDRRATLALLLAATVSLPARSAAPAAAKLLVGKWQHVSLQATDDGLAGPVRQAVPGHAALEYRRDGTWELTGPNYTGKGTYRWLDRQRVEHTIVDASVPAQRGAVSVKTVRVDADRLELVTVNTRAEMDRISPPKPGSKRADVSVVTSVFRRGPP